MTVVTDNQASLICNSLLNDVVKSSAADNSLKFFRKDFASRTVWLFILKAFFSQKKINIEKLARSVSSVSTIPKPTLRLILDNAAHKGYLKFIKSKSDLRSVNIELTPIVIKEFKEWCAVIKSMGQSPYQ